VRFIGATAPLWDPWDASSPPLRKLGTESKSLSRRSYCSSSFIVGADFHSAMVATAPGEKLLIGRRPVRSWTRRTICRKSHSFSGKSTKTAATRAALFDSNMQQIVCRLRLRPRPHWGSLQPPPGPLAVFRGLTSNKKRKVGTYVFC